MFTDKIFESLNEGKALLEKFISDKKNIEIVNRISEEIATAFKAGKKVIICGNGGSLTDAMHFAEELTGRFRDNRNALPAIAIADPSHITCCANDFGFENIFSRGVEAYGNIGDIFIGLSTSGNSPNIINAVDKAKELNLLTFSFLGKDGGKLKGMCDFEIIVDGKTSDRIQEIHMMVLHIIVEIIERIIFPENYECKK
ncbi:MAG: D-sedoheptulose 7-phosphate isomerase [Candidatus Delongbacteria bacterium]|nr:D-sedoheptulose 7-phosphate isomerase [Candidatus Delongbacteria bacterium]MBN2834496.1 D-sedoheptulose 7-phosphate isomerase [Candidatus Delongbacteria bacterium]